MNPLDYTRFEYKIVTSFVLREAELTLNGMGNQGWELVQIIPDSGRLVLFLRRVKNEVAHAGETE